MDLQGFRFDPLPPPHVLELGRRWRKGDRAARERLVETHLRFVVSLARRFRGSGLPDEDLVAHGVEGLLVALGRWDPARGALTTYARAYVLQAMQDYAIEQGGVVSCSRGSGAAKNLWWRAPVDVSLDAPAREDSDRPRLDLLGAGAVQDATGTEWSSLRAALVEAVTSGMGPNAHAVVEARWSDTPPTIEALAERLSLSRQRVAQLEALARTRAQAILCGQAARFGLEEELRDRPAPRGAARARRSFWLRLHWARLRNDPRALRALKAKIRAARAKQVMPARTEESKARAGRSISASKQRRKQEEPEAWAAYRAKLSKAAKARKRGPRSQATKDKIRAACRAARAAQLEARRSAA